MSYYSIELIDINDNIENFKFNKVSKEHLKNIKDILKNDSSGCLEFSCVEGEILLQAKFFRGLMYAPYVEPPKTIVEETLENSVEVTKIELPRIRRANDLRKD